MDPLIRTAETDQAADELQLTGLDAFALKRRNSYRLLIMVRPVPTIGC